MSRKSPGPQPQSVSDLAAQLWTALSRLKRQMREHGGRTDLTHSQMSVLRRLDKGGPDTVSGLARAEGLRPQSMSAIVASLQSAGMLIGISDPNDGRKILMSLTRKCQKNLREGRAAKQDWLTTVIQKKLSTQEQQQLSAALELLSRLSDDGLLS